MKAWERVVDFKTAEVTKVLAPTGGSGANIYAANVGVCFVFLFLFLWCFIYLFLILLISFFCRV